MSKINKYNVSISKIDKISTTTKAIYCCHYHSLFLSGANSVIGKAIVIHAGQSTVVNHVIMRLEKMIMVMTVSL